MQKAAAKAQRDRVPDDQAPGTSPGEEYLAEDAVEEPVSTTSGSSGGGSPTAGLVALALLGALGAAGLLIARRRGTG